MWSGVDGYRQQELLEMCVILGCDGRGVDQVGILEFFWRQRLEPAELEG